MHQLIESLIKETKKLLCMKKDSIVRIFVIIDHLNSKVEIKVFILSAHIS